MVELILVTYAFGQPNIPCITKIIFMMNKTQLWIFTKGGKITTNKFIIKKIISRLKILLSVDDNNALYFEHIL